jgi:hypothetical protein
VSHELQRNPDLHTSQSDYDCAVCWCVSRDAVAHKCGYVCTVYAFLMLLTGRECGFISVDDNRDGGCLGCHWKDGTGVRSSEWINNLRFHKYRLTCVSMLAL